MSAPSTWSATELAAAIRTRQLSSTEAVTACLDRAEAVNGQVNALIDVDAERALRWAAEVDRGAGEGLLRGVPISIKDNVDEAGQINSGGLVVGAAGPPATEDAPVVANLRAAGAISIGRSNVPAFSLRWFSDNEVYGRTLNPYNKDVTPGGSSGGAAAAVATGIVPLAHGNDIGGSVRYPAHVCGVMGLRPAVGRIPSWVTPEPKAPGLPPSPLMMAVEGVLARTVADLELGLTAMAVPDLRDPACVPAPFARAAPLAPGTTTLGLVRSTGESPAPDADHDAALDAAAAQLRDAGFAVEEIELPQLAEAHRLWLLLLHADMLGEMDMFNALGGAAIVRNMENNFDTLRELLGGMPDLDMYVKGHLRRTALIAEVQAVLTRYPVILLPGSGVPAPPHDADQDPVTARALLHGQWPNTTVPLLGLPGLTLPVGGAGADGLPFGVQLVGGRFGESALLDAAEAIEARAPALVPVDPRG
jgi:amidase